MMNFFIFLHCIRLRTNNIYFKRLISSFLSFPLIWFAIFIFYKKELLLFYKSISQLDI